MTKRGYGRIINIASAHGLRGSANKSAYCAAKHGVVGLTKAIALETAGSGVTANSVCPGWVLTPLVQQQIEARAAKSGRSLEAETALLVSEKHPSSQPVAPEHLAQLVVFLCSSAGAQITGTELSVDGGWTAR
uniref:3-oxoacyl-[acyl-carrier-protein] reductase n=1 Tax=Haptolina brevifila TaxID=156173 RepID=A0A7S2G5H2_9EUKA|mmetsp:Transcript_26422/g.53085  ORF Transcript_26422/g.53085 Transcript_26422/m.53085 type:complete len:133 (+) Transcript_26422:576-974(+)